jgi:hypothetical protein
VYIWLLVVVQKYDQKFFRDYRTTVLYDQYYIVCKIGIGLTRVVSSVPFFIFGSDDIRNNNGVIAYCSTTVCVLSRLSFWRGESDEEQIEENA